MGTTLHIIKNMNILLIRFQCEGSIILVISWNIPSHWRFYPSFRKIHYYTISMKVMYHTESRSNLQQKYSWKKLHKFSIIKWTQRMRIFQCLITSSGNQLKWLFLSGNKRIFFPRARDISLVDGRVAPGTAAAAAALASSHHCNLTNMQIIIHTFF